MDPDRNRRAVALVLLCLLVIVTSWIDSHYRDFNPALRSAAKLAQKSSTSQSAAPEAKKRRKASAEEEWLEIIAFDEDETEDEEDEGSEKRTKSRKRKEREMLDKAVKAHSKHLLRSATFRFNLYACLPRFICEIHAEPPGSLLTDLEKDILSLFRNYVVLESPGSYVYTYQLAAHMGHLMTGLQPSPCYNLYPSCPLSRTQLLDILSGMKSTRRIFY